MASLNIDRNDLPEGQSFDPLPEGWYQAEIVAADLKPTSTGGQMIGFGYKIEGPTHIGRLVNFQNVNIKNANPTAEEIGKGQLNMIMGSVGLNTVQDTDQFIGAHLMIKLAIKPAGSYEKGGVTKTYDAGNEVKGWKAIEGGMPPVAGPYRASPPSAPSTPSSTPPWAKPKS